MKIVKIVKWSVSALLALVLGGLAFVYFSPGYDMYVVRSESMVPAINMGDIIVSGPLWGPINGGVRPSTIVTYELGKALVTHRVMSIKGDILVTKGDAMEDPDPRPVSISQVKGVYLFKIPYIGYLSSYMRTKTGWFSIVIIPGMLLVCFLAKDIVREALKDDSEEKVRKPAVATVETVGGATAPAISAAKNAVEGWAATSRQTLSQIWAAGKPALAMARTPGGVSGKTAGRVWEKSRVSGETTVRVWEKNRPVPVQAASSIVVRNKEIDRPAEAAVDFEAREFEEWMSALGEMDKMPRKTGETPAGTVGFPVEAREMNKLVREAIEALENIKRSMGPLDGATNETDGHLGDDFGVFSDIESKTRR